MILLPQIAVLLATCIVLVKLTSLMREFRAEMERNRAAVPAAESSILSSLVCLTGKVDRLLAGGVRIEGAAAIVADELADSRHRADETQGVEGAAADAASRSGDESSPIRGKSAGEGGGDVA